MQMTLHLELKANIKNGENVLTKDLHSLAEYCAKWRLGLNPVKTETSAFHLNSQMAKAKIHVKLNGKDLPFNSTPKYLRVVLDQTLTYEENSEKIAQKVKTRVNLIAHLAGTVCGAKTELIRTATLTLVF